MAQETIRISTIETVSPTLAETLRQCRLRAGLSRVEGSSQYVLGNPKAWLGRAYHAVMEAVAAAARCGNDIEARVRDAWHAAIEREYQRSRGHPFDKRFGPPESWPGYHLVAAMALVRARELANYTRAQSSPPSYARLANAAWREEKFATADGKVVGRPDVVLPGAIVDFKTGDVFEEEDQDQIKASYVRQLRLYAYLVKETLGWWPQRGVLIPMAGSPVAVELAPDECESEAETAKRLLDEYNEALSRALDPIELASPSPASCRWCPYQLYCPGFWGAVVPEWKNGLGAAAIAGDATGPAKPIHSWSALSLSLHVKRGTSSPSQTVSLFPLDPSIHEDVPLVKDGDPVRVTGLRTRADESLVATRRTLVSRERVLPQLQIDV
jgi:hypothetical protein